MSKDDSGKSSLSPSAQMWKLIWPGAMAAQVVYAAAKLGLVDSVIGEPKTAEELAATTKAHAPSLKRLLRALVSLDIFIEDPPDKFRPTPLGETLRKDHPSSIRTWAVFLGSPFVWNPWGGLYETVITGKTAFPRLHGQAFFNYLADHPDDAKTFNDAMSAGSSVTAKDLLASYDFSRFEKIVDVGGGQGELLYGILMANPKAHGVLFDLPSVVSGANALKTGEVATRCEVVAGDFFERVPEGGDVYIFKTVIHDWDDEEALKILRNCRRAIKMNGHLLLVDTILSASNRPESGLMDAMALVLGGRERTEAEFRALLREAGFSLIRVIPARNSSVVEGQPS
ncbi:MAG TPA: methyltransferase [Nitrososphaerales archaeon]|nr:methyltransferase [Nitrososphaerales archaeon]